MKGSIQKRKFFESLRPAQKKARRPRGVAREGTTRGDPRDGHRGGTRDSEEKFEYNNTTTKSLILAQDER